MSKHLVLAGGGHAHMMLLANISEIRSQGHSVTVIQPSDHHYYSGMGPGMLSGHYSADDIRFQTRYVVERQGGTFINNKVTRIDPHTQEVILEDRTEIGYDVLSCNTGSFVPFHNIEGNRETLYSVKPIERLQQAQQHILSLSMQPSLSIAVIGGGPAAIEIAGNSQQLAHDAGCKDVRIDLFGGRKIMKDFDPGIQKRARNILSQRGITLHESGYVERIESPELHLENGTTHTADIMFLATGVQPSPIFAESGIATGPDGGLKVNEFLQAPDHTNIFGGGDCIYYAPEPLAKVGVYAVRQNPVLLHNVIGALNNTAPRPFDPGGNYLLIFNLGKKTGLLKKGPLLFGGKLAFTIKDYIDRKFMREFQALEE